MSTSDILGPPPMGYDAHEHHARLASLLEDHPYKTNAKTEQHLYAVLNHAYGKDELPASDVCQALLFFILGVLDKAEVYGPKLPPPEGDIAYVRFRYETLERAISKEGIGAAVGELTEWLERFKTLIPVTPDGQDGAPTVPLYQLVHTSLPALVNLCGQLFMARRSDGHPTYQHLGNQYIRNVADASGVDDLNNPGKAMVMPQQSKLTGAELLTTYLKDTPAEELLLTPVAFTIPERIRYEHTHVLGGSGHGKSTLLTHQLLSDLQSENSPALIIIDGKGTFVDEVRRFAQFAPGSPLSERLVILDPREIDRPPALNMFARTETRADATPAVKLQIEEETINSFSYIFGASDFKMTEKQGTCLSYAARLLFTMPAPTLQTLLDLMADPLADTKLGGVKQSSPFKPYIETLPPHYREFMQSLFYHPTEFTETKRQIRNRIYSLLKHPSFAAMFLTEQRKLDLFDVIQSRKILLVNSSPAAIGETGAQLLGRYIIAQALTSAYGRLAVPKSQWAPAHLIIDEAQMFIDEDKTQPLLQQAREFNLGVTLAHQKLADLTPKLIATVAANTSIRYVGGVSAADASFMAKNMNCEPDFIMSQRKSGAQTHFATYVRGFTERPVSLAIPLGIIDKQPKMTGEQFKQLSARNSAALAVSRTPEPPQPLSEPAPAPQPPPVVDKKSTASPETDVGSTESW